MFDQLGLLNGCVLLKVNKQSKRDQETKGMLLEDKGIAQSGWMIPVVAARGCGLLIPSVPKI